MEDNKNNNNQNDEALRIDEIIKASQNNRPAGYNPNRDISSYSDSEKRHRDEEYFDDYDGGYLNGKSNRNNSGKNMKKRKKRKKGVPGAVWGLLIVVISLALAVAILLVGSEITGLGKEILTGNSNITQIYVNEGETISEIADSLAKNNLIVNKELFLLYVKYKKIDPSTFKFGFHDFKSNMGFDEIIATLNEDAKSADISVIIPAGSNIENIAAIMERKKVCSADHFKLAAKKRDYDSWLMDYIPDDSRIKYPVEGYISPDTYKFYENDNAERVIERLLKFTEEKFTPELVEKIDNSGRALHNIMTMASIVELEASGYNAEMPYIAAVFYNRIEKWPQGQRKLQSDPTVVFTDEFDLNIAYNTYETEGFPPGPYCSVSQAALEAAISPAENFEDYFFFVTDSLNRFYYNRTAADHNSTISSLISEGLWKE